MRRIVLLACAGLAACTVGPDFTPPPPPALPAFHDLARNADTAVTPLSDPDPLWWNAFHDPVLTRLMNDAIAGSPTLQEALLRVVTSQQNVITAAAAGLPTLNGNASYMREQLGIKGILESKGAYSSLDRLADADNVNTPLGNTGMLGSQASDEADSLLNQLAAPINLYQYGLSSSWELDLFGRVRRSVEAAKASTQAQREAANDALVMLESEIGQAYFQLRGAQFLAQQQQENIRAAQDSLQLTNDRVARGLTTDIDVAQAQTELDNELTQAQMYDKQAAQAMDQINVLAGQPPGALDALLAPAPLPPMPDLVGVGVPASLARRRPDIREAEAELHAATADVGVAVASFYPDISLTGSAGLRATDASFLTNWASLFYSAGPTVTLPIFQGGELAANLRTARAQQAVAALNYRSAVLNALREVEDALVAYRTDQIAAAAAAATVQQADLSFYLSNNRYTHGLSSYLQVLSAEQTLVSARQQAAQAQVQVATDVVTLYTALGGGWQATPIAVPTLPIAPPPLPGAIDSLAAGR